MKRFNSLMPMYLQFFAEDAGGGNGGNPTPPVDPNQEPKLNDEPEDGSNHEGDPNPDDDSEDNPNPEPEEPDKVIKKLQNRIGKEVSEKSELQQQLEKAQEELNKLKSGKKADKQPEKTPEQIKVEQLQRQLDHRDMLDQTLEVFQESNINMPKEVVEMLIRDDHDETVSNAEKLLNFVTSVQKETEAKVRADYGGGVPSATTHKDGSNFGAELAKSADSRPKLQTRY